MQKEVDKREIDAVNIQFYALILTFLSAVISIIITYNQKRNLRGEKPIFNGKQIFNITLFNRILILSLSFVFLYVNYILFQVSKDQGENLKPYKLQLLASAFVIVSGIIALYVVSLSNTETIADVENTII